MTSYSGPIQQSEQTATKEKSQELHSDDKPVAKMPRIVTMERKRENGKKVRLFEKNTYSLHLHCLNFKTCRTSLLCRLKFKV